MSAITNTAGQSIMYKCSSSPMSVIQTTNGTYPFTTTTTANVTYFGKVTNVSDDTLQPIIDTYFTFTMGHAYFILTGITSVLSIFGSVIIILTYLKYKDLRSSSRKLLVYVSIADFLTACGNLSGIIWYICKNDMTEAQSDGLCYFHASLTIFSSISSFLWTVAIGIHLYLFIVRSDAILANKLIWPFHVICWIIPSKS